MDKESLVNLIATHHDPPYPINIIFPFKGKVNIYFPINDNLSKPTNLKEFFYVL